MIRKLLPFIFLTIIPAIVVFILMEQNEVINKVHTELYKNSESKSADHSKFEILQQEFKTPQEVTAACLTCHTERHTEVMKMSHWNWSIDENVKGKGFVPYGKKNGLNNFCIGTSSNEALCMTCHIGYGWKDKNFNFKEKQNIDCLVCHDNTSKYKKEVGKSGNPVTTIDLSKIAQGIGKTSKKNCGACHFKGGGGNNVKHGDLESALLSCSREVDVHMSRDSLNLSCTDCHKTKNHKMLGKLYTVSSENKDRATCQSCHTEMPHSDDLLNEHCVKVSCQTCHIPIYAKVNPTKMTWDWSTAGKMDENGKLIKEKDKNGYESYFSKKGSFLYQKNVTPEYLWFNGTASHYLLGEKVDTNSPVQINTLYGSYADNNSKIIPVKTFRGKQIYDTENNILINPKLYPTTKGDGAYWKEFNWDAAARAGMKSIGQEYSGHYGFIKTESYWPLNHMVSKKEAAVSCKECHSKHNSRLAGLNDFYMPGRDSSILDLVGKIIIILSLIGVSIHIFFRIKYRKVCFIEDDK